MEYCCIMDEVKPFEKSLMLRYAAFRPRSENYCWGPGVREEYVVQYVKEGKGYLESDGRRFPVYPGQCFVLFPGVVLNYYKDPTDPWTYGWVEFGGPEAESLLSYTSLSPHNPVTAPVSQETVALFQQMEDCFLDRSPASDCKGTGLLHLLLSELILMHPSDQKQKKIDSGEISEKAATLIRQDYRRSSLNVTSLAQKLNIDRSSLYRHFVQEIGKTPSDFITQVRMEKAIHLIESGAYSVKTISYSVGFSDPLYFSRVFRRHTGMSPQKYILEYQKKSNLL